MASRKQELFLSFAFSHSPGGAIRISLQQGPGGGHRQTRPIGGFVIGGINPATTCTMPPILSITYFGNHTVEATAKQGKSASPCNGNWSEGNLETISGRLLRNLPRSG